MADEAVAIGPPPASESYLVIEKISEVGTVLRVADEMDVRPSLGIRVKLSATGAGRWHSAASLQSPQWMEPFRFTTEDVLARPLVGPLELDLPLNLTLRTTPSR